MKNEVCHTVPDPDSLCTQETRIPLLSFKHIDSPFTVFFPLSNTYSPVWVLVPFLHSYL